MKKILSVLFFSIACSSFGQIIKGDMNGDGQLNISDVTKSVNVLLGKESMEYISADHDPYLVRNKDIVGKWYINKTESVTFKEDGTTDYAGATKYEYLPYQGCVLFYDKSGECIAAYKILKATSSSILWSKVELTSSYITSSVPVYKVKAITLDQTSITMGPDATVRLTPEISPINADNTNVKWTTSNADCAMVVNGLVLGVSAGTATITCKAADGSGAYAKCEVRILDKPVTKITMSLKMDTLFVGNTKTYKATVSPSTAEDKTLVWTSSDPTVATISSAGKVTVLSPGETTISVVPNGGVNLIASCTITVPPSVDGHEYVDLGLPSGTCWAKCNIGAETPEGAGNYYAWGETKAYGEEDTSNSRNYSYQGSYKKTYYSWSTYKWCSSSSNMTKYCISSSYGTVDNKTTLELSDDAAYINWGKSWRMPTADELKELYYHCYWVRTTNYEGTGKAGYYVYKQKHVLDTGTSHGSSYTYSSSDAHIFVPSTGYRYNSYFNSGSGYFYYWSSTLSSSTDVRCYTNYPPTDLSTMPRYYALPIRPVVRVK